MKKMLWADLKRIPYLDGYWMATWSVIYLSFLTLDIFAPGFYGSSVLKYVGIFLCIIYAMQKYRKDYKLTLALFFTFLADTILVWTTQEVAGVFVFCFAQALHFLRLTKLQRKYLMIFIFIVPILVIISGIRHDNILYSLAALYGLLLVSNVTMSIRNFRTHRKDFRARCACYGFLAFICCDICVGVRHLMLDGLMPDTFLPLIAYLVWVFYYPSQVLLANSSNIIEPTIKSPKAKKVAKKSTIS
jgi:hypothetical protein